jgi:hypothetical protein
MSVTPTNYPLIMLDNACCIVLVYQFFCFNDLSIRQFLIRNTSYTVLLIYLAVLFTFPAYKAVVGGVRTNLETLEGTDREDWSPGP